VTLPDLFDLSFVGRRLEPAIEWDRLYTFGEMDDRASRMAHLLADRGSLYKQNPKKQYRKKFFRITN